MPKPSDKAPTVKKAEPYHWELQPEPAATPRDRRWLGVSVTVLLVWLAVLAWLAYR